MNKTKLLIEFILIFVLPPLLIVLGVMSKVMIMPLMWLIALYAYLHLRRAKVNVLAIDFDSQALYSILKRFLFIGAAINIFVFFYRPDLFLVLLKEEPLRWLELMILYPILSAYTQEIVFRNFFFYRYEKLFEKRIVLFVVINALLFSYIHIVFENWVAVVFTFVGGVLFALTFLKTRSTLLVSIEHSIYGNALYTLGLGYYFYHGSNI
ncbi:MAG: hypothetical protein AUK54_02250 [Helicobacteraceae bacterium CG2_30_36_10]|nr:MAG: hypothetical protein AUK54_02250 [Helicobacteraceae bacterium CG2_30_36_10]